MASAPLRRPLKDSERASMPSQATDGAGKSSQRSGRKPLRPRKTKRKEIFSRVQMCSIAGVLVGLCLLITAMTVVFYSKGDRHSIPLPSFITPLPQPKIMELPQFKGKHREDLFWGTYRPNLYLGIRTRTPRSLLAGLMWIGTNNGVYTLRHTCEDSDNLAKYGWLRHDGLGYGHQEIIDKHMSISTSFLKKKDPASGYGGDWAVRLNITSSRKLDAEAGGAISLFFYMADEDGEAMQMFPSGLRSKEAGALVSGFRKGIGGWELHAMGMDEADLHYAGFHTPHMHNLTQLVWQTMLVQARMNGRLQLPDGFEASSNVAVFQITSKMPLELDLVFVSGTEGKPGEVQARLYNLSGPKLSKQLEEHEATFDNRFKDVFNLQEKVDYKSLEVGKAALSNLLGGIGYFFGQSRIAIPPGLQGKNGQSFWLYWPAALYTAVPSRITFPRGFLWDEGFHQLLIRQWDPRLSKEIIGHWLDLMNVDGWIPREQILGSEALSKVPEEFVLQHTSNANPPTFFLVLEAFASKLMKNSSVGYSNEEDLNFLKRSFPRLEAWFNWFNSTQIGKVHGSFFWHGRDPTAYRELNPKTLSSGLDDYPRASHPNSDERHLDLRCWMALAAKSMNMIAQLVGAEYEKYQATATELSNFDLLNKLHYDGKTGHYCDYGNHTEKVRLQWKILEEPRSGHIHKELVRVVLKQPELCLVPQFGYVSLFPFIMKIIPADSPILGKQLDLIRDENLLWTGYGLRSLANTSSMYMKRNTEHDPPYWRGPVWISLNYMVLCSLHHYSQVSGPYRNNAAQLYDELRGNLIRNVVERYYESGYLWEQYDNVADGRGKGSHPFTGWTSLIVLVMAEMY